MCEQVQLVKNKAIKVSRPQLLLQFLILCSFCCFCPKILLTCQIGFMWMKNLPQHNKVEDVHCTVYCSICCVNAQHSLPNVAWYNSASREAVCKVNDLHLQLKLVRLE